MSASVPTTVILNVCPELILRSSRAAILQSAGYIVTSVASTKQAIYSCLEHDFDLVVLCHTIPDEQQLKYIAQIRELGFSIPVFLLEPLVSEGLIKQSDGSYDLGPRSLLKHIDEAVRSQRATHIR